MKFLSERSDDLKAQYHLLSDVFLCSRDNMTIM